jgi:hypothetical protein
MEEEVFYSRVKGGSCTVHVGGHCCMQTAPPADLYFIPKREAIIMSQYEKKREWSLLRREKIPKDAVRMSIDKEKLDGVMSAHEELLRAYAEEGKRIWDYEKRHGKFPNGSFLTKLASEIKPEEFKNRFHKACEETFVPPQNQ